MMIPAALLGLFLLAQTPAEVPVEPRLRLVEQINADRKAAGLAPVLYSGKLSRAADAHCAEMLREGYTSHWNRAGWKPYMRYAAAGIRDYTAENIWSHTSSGPTVSADTLWAELLEGHQGFMAEQPPRDGHRRTILNPEHTHVGIGVAYNSSGIRLIEVFATRRAQLDPIPARAALDDSLQVRGRVAERGVEFFSISVFYEPLPQEMSVAELRRTHSYGLPHEEWVERPKLVSAIYTDGTYGTVEVDALGNFSVPLRYWKGKPGVYTIAVWVRPEEEKPLIGAMTSVIVEEAKGRATPPPRGPGAAGRLRGAWQFLPGAGPAIPRRGD